MLPPLCNPPESLRHAELHVGFLQSWPGCTPRAVLWSQLCSCLSPSGQEVTQDYTCEFSFDLFSARILRTLAMLSALPTTGLVL
jgi:hypothetical protein